MTALRVVFSPEAENDLEAIADYIAADNPRRALEFIETLRTCCDHLTTFPLRNPVYGETEGVTVRKYPYKHYIIYYGVQGDTLSIFHIWHAARRQPGFG